MAPDTYHGYASESDYHEHYCLLGELETTRSRRERQTITTRITEILERRVYVETRGPINAR